MTRLVLGQSIKSRNGLVNKDAKVVNGILEPRGEDLWVRKRPGSTLLGFLRSGAAQLLYYWNGVKAIVGDFFISVSAFGYTISATIAARTTPSASNWIDVAYGNGRYIAVASTGQIAYSTDGLTWTAGTSITNRGWTGIAFNGTVFCVISNTSNATAVTSDGITWNEATSRLPTTGFTGIAANSTTFVTPLFGGSTVAYSTDGITWNSGSMPSSANWRYIAWNGSAFCARVDGSTSAATSSDGISWTARTLSVSLSSGGIAGGNGIFVAVGTGGSASTSSNGGASWTTATMPGAVSWSGIAWNGSVFFAVASGTSTAGFSVDGITWQSASLTSAVPSWKGTASNGSGFVVTSQSATNAQSVTAVTVTPTVTSTQTGLSPSSAGLQFSAQDNGANAATDLLMIKNATQAWTINGAGTITQITDTDYPGTYQVGVSSLTRSGTTATAVTTIDTNFQVGSSVTVAGATPAAYNGTFTITAVSRANAQTFPTVPITISRSGTTATATCTSGTHGFANGDTVTIAGAGQSEYNGNFVITYISSTQFSFTVVVTSALPATPATGSPVISDAPFAGGGATQDSGTPTNWTLTQLSSAINAPAPSGGTVTIKTLSPAFFSTGNYAITSVSGTTFTITVPSTTTYLGIFTASWSGNFVPPSISSITRVGTVVTVTTAAAHSYLTGQVLTISGCTQYQYNGQFTITVTGANTFTYEIAAESPITPATGSITAKKPDIIAQSSFSYTVAGSPATPATGTITATSGRTTVPGIAYLDGYFCVMDVQGVIYSSASDDPQTWNPLDYTTALAESGAGKAIARSLSYVVAFKEFSTEFFYNDTTITTGSPLRPVESGFTQIGCANGWSLANLDGSLVWVGQTKQDGRAVYMMQGIQQQKISTPDVERIINLDPLVDVFAYGMRLDGHPVYILTLVSTDLTLVYDASNQTWQQWSSLTIGASKSVTSITRSDTTVTVTVASGHGLNDGDPVNIQGATQTEYNGIHQAFVVSSTVFTFELDTTPASPATGTILMYPYTESSFRYTHYCSGDNRNYVLHKTDGSLYDIDPTYMQDNGIPISVLLRTERIDGGSLEYKAMSEAKLVGDTITGFAAIRYSDDDMQTQTPYRHCHLYVEQPMIRRLGRFRRRTMEVRYVEDQPLNLVALEVTTS